MLSKSRVKYIQSLYHKKFRDEEAIFVVEGPKIVDEFLQHAPAQITAIYALKSWAVSQEELTGRFLSENIVIIDEDDLKKISSLSTPNQVIALVRKKAVQELTDVPAAIMLMLDDIQDPGNFGTIIRIADWFGINTVLCSTGCVDMYNPKVIQSTMGSIMRVNIFYTNLIEWHKTNPGIKMYAAALQGNSLYGHPAIEEGIIVLGNESKGIKPELLEFCYEKITIPRIGQAESLNAAVAAGIILSHII